MTALVIGPNGSGKSSYAERLTASLPRGGGLYYIATMRPYGEEGILRVEKHKEQRKGYGFVTIEAPLSVSDIDIPDGATVLLEDVSNLLGNAVFELGQTPDMVYDDILKLARRYENLVLVSIGGLKLSDGGDEGTRKYIAALEWLNHALSCFVDKTFVMKEGEPCEEAYF